MRLFVFPTKFVLILFLLGTAARATEATGTSLTAQEQKMSTSPQYNNGKFVNKLPMSEDDFGVLDFLDMMHKFFSGSEVREPQQPVKIYPLTAQELAGPVNPDLGVRWLGHSTLIIEIEGKRILTDPVWSKRVSPVKFIGPKRFYKPLVAIEDLPELDAIILSHDHYDHLDKPSIKKLNQLEVHFYVPLGLGEHLQAWGVAAEKIHEFDWWESVDIGGVVLHCTPARHFSGRGVLDRNHTLWSSWSIVGQKRRLFFSGDSGLFPGFSEIGDRLGPFDITLMESGAYNTKWPDVHMGPEQAVIAHRALRGKMMIPIHWGLFNLAYHSWTEPAERLRIIATRDGESIAFPRPGQEVLLGSKIPTKQWWPAIKWQTSDEVNVQSTHMPSEWLHKYRADKVAQLPASDGVAIAANTVAATNSTQ